MVFALAFCGLASVFPNRAVASLFFALCFSESVLNGLFHVGATALSGVYCPGLITALVLYPPLFWYLSQVAYRGGLLTNTLGGVLDRRGDSHCGRSHERVRCKAPVTSPYDLMLRKPSEVKRSVAFGGPNHSKATRQDRVSADRSTSL